MPPKPFHIDTRHFAKKGDAEQFFRNMLNRYKPGDRVAAEDARDLAALLKRHTEYASKIGAGISHFEVMNNIHDTQSFAIIRTDGTSDDFSFYHCITPKKD